MLEVQVFICKPNIQGNEGSRNRCRVEDRNAGLFIKGFAVTLPGSSSRYTLVSGSQSIERVLL